MPTESQSRESFEISVRFRQSVENRIARLEEDAARDEQILMTLDHKDHLRRHRRLVAVQRAEALRMRLFLDSSKTRTNRPLVQL